MSNKSNNQILLVRDGVWDLLTFMQENGFVGYSLTLTDSINEQAAITAGYSIHIDLRHRICYYANNTPTVLNIIVAGPIACRIVCAFFNAKHHNPNQHIDNLIVPLLRRYNPASNPLLCLLNETINKSACIMSHFTWDYPPQLSMCSRTIFIGAAVVHKKKALAFNAVE